MTRADRKRRAEIVRLVVTTRERFPHSPKLTAALRRVLWRYVTQPSPPAERRRRTKPTRKPLKRRKGGAG